MPFVNAAPHADHCRPLSADRLHVLTMVSNPARYASRYRLYHEFARRVDAAGAVLWTAEVAFGERPHAVTSPGHPRHLQLRTAFELWHKENALNLLAARLPADWKYAAWVDADVAFARPDWAEETVQQLQHHAVVQMFGQCADLDASFSLLAPDRSGEQLPSMMRQHVDATAWGGRPYGRHAGHCGYAWAIRRDAWDALGGLVDFSICGANDHHMARALVGDVLQSVNGKCSAGLKDELSAWGARAKRLRGNVGYVPGLALHYWHGSKRNRRYIDRWEILARSQFDPRRDLSRDWQGLYQLTDDGTPRSAKLRDDIRAYFRQRDEDAPS